MRTDYHCLNCRHQFPIQVSEAEARAGLDPGRTEVCPRCAQHVGMGPVRCRSCGGTFVLSFPHWHLQCDLANGACPGCGARVVSPCIC